MELSDTQNEFLYKFYNNCGSIRQTLDEIGLEYVHFRTWLKDVYFLAKFEETRLDVNRFLTIDNESMAKRRLNELLHDGIVEIEEVSFVQLDSEDRVVNQSTATKVKRKVAIDALKQVLGEKSTEHCINVLAERGILSRAVARKLLSTGIEYQQKLQESFGDNENNDKMNDEKAICLVRQALLGTNEEIH